MDSQQAGDNRYLAIRTVIEITRTADVLDDVFSRHLARFGLSRAKFNALVHLRHATGLGLTLSELGQKLLVSRANITGLIDRLEKDGFVFREADPRDRRVFRARLSQRAEDLLEKIMPLHGNFTAQALSGLNDREKEQLLKLLQKLRTSLEQI